MEAKVRFLTCAMALTGLGQQPPATIQFSEAVFGAYNDPCVQALLMQPDGKVVIGGCFTNVGGLSRSGIARLNGDGSVDQSFDPGSGVSGASGGTTTVFALALQLDGKMVLGGSFLRVNGSSRPSLAPSKPDGALDEIFKADVIALGRGYPDVRQVIVQGDGRILFAGYFPDGSGVARLNAEGSLDATFRSEQALPPAAQVYAIALQADGKIRVGGVNSGGRPHLIRLIAGGLLDTIPPGGTVELWTINGGSHGPTLYNGTSSSEFAPRVIDWLLAHPKP